jgi:hypothetical protein
MRRLLLASTVFLLSCGYDGGYRYPCQDPENWGNAECKPPVCLVDGTCTDMLLGFDPDSATTTTEPTTETTAP